MRRSRQHETWSELAARETDGLAASLFWRRAAGRTRARVVPQMLRADLPFAYAAGAGLGFGLREARALDLEPSERSAAR